VQRALATWNALALTTGNITANDSEIPDGHYDFESTALHELGSVKQ
jgi:hypothetical protein